MTQDIGDDIALCCIPRRAADRVWNQFKAERCVTVNSAERNWRSEEFLDITHGDAEFGLCLDGFGIILTQYFLSMLYFLLWGMDIYVAIVCLK